MAGGRPTKYKPEYCKDIVDYLSQGRAIVEFCAKIGISVQTLHRWREAHPEFSDAYEEAKAKCEAWWANVVIDAIHRNSKGETIIDTNLYKWITAARFKWGQETTVNHNHNIEPLEIGTDDDDEN